VKTTGPDPQRGSGPVFFTRRKIYRLLGVGGVLAGAILWLIFELQKLGTFPRPAAGAQRLVALSAGGGEAIWLDADGARTEAWLLPAAGSAPTPLLINAHGNGELIDMQVGQVEGLRVSGIAVLLVEYPGYGRSAGSPSEHSVTAAMVAAYDWAAHDRRFDAQRIIGYGRSLGGGAIGQLAARRPLAAVVLESTFTSVTDIIRGLGIPEFLMLNHFDTRTALAAYRGPVLLLHGSHDNSIPVAHAKALHAALLQSELHVFDCGHNDCPRQWELILSFLARNGVCRKPDSETPHEKVSVC